MNLLKYETWNSEGVSLININLMLVLTQVNNIEVQESLYEILL